MVGIISWLKGYVRIRVTGLSVERFINLCGHKNILLWDVIRAEGYWEMCISIKAFKQLRPIVKKTGTRVAIIERCGLPFFMSQMNKKKVFLVGFFFTVFFWYASANFVWKIEIEGNYRITQEQLKDYLAEQKIGIGTLKKSIDIEALEKALRMEFTDIIWTSGKFEGTTFHLAVKENDGIQVKEITEEGVGYDLVAHTDGEIYSMVVRQGVPKVKQGDVVTKDMILVEGRIPVNNDDGTVREYLYEKADADIFIKHTITYEDSLEEKYIKKVYTGQEKKYFYVRFGEKQWTVGQTKPYLVYDAVVQETTPAILKELKIPLLWGQYTYREYQNTECLYTKEEASEILKKNLLQFLATLEEKGVQIIEKDVKIEKKVNTYEVSGGILVAEPVENLMPTPVIDMEVSTEKE